MIDTIPTLVRGKGRPREFDRDKALCAALHVFWEQGYEPASVAELCKAMGINPPSLYASFGNKASLFLEAVRHYHRLYWREPFEKFKGDSDIHMAVRNLFDSAARILLSPDLPCGCMVVLAAVNISKEETEIIASLRDMRLETKKMFSERLRKAIMAGQIPADTDVPALAAVLNTLLEGMSLQARDCMFQSELMAIAAFAERMLPPMTQHC